MGKINLLGPAPSELNKAIIERIKRRRRQIMVHSAIYYKLGTSIIPDTQFDSWAYELVELQKQYPNESKKAELYEDFKDWDGTTGFNLNYTPFLSIAENLVNYCRRKDEHKEV